VVQVKRLSSALIVGIISLAIIRYSIVIFKSTDDIHRIPLMRTENVACDLITPY